MWRRRHCLWRSTRRSASMSTSTTRELVRTTSLQLEGRTLRLPAPSNLPAWSLTSSSLEDDLLLSIKGPPPSFLIGATTSLSCLPEGASSTRAQSCNTAHSVYSYDV